MTRYMHTLDGRPAAYYERDGICFESKRIKLATSLRQIRREHRKDELLQIAEGRSQQYKRGYVTVRVSK